MLVVFCGAIMPVRYDIAIGMVPRHTITANRDVVDEVTTEALRTAAAQAVQPTYHFVEGVTESVLSNFDQIFSQMKAVIQYSETLEDYGPNRRYAADELAYARTILTLLDLRDYQLRTLLNTTHADLSSLYTTLYAAVQNTMASYVTEGQENEAVASIMQIVGYRVDTSLLQNIVQPLLRTVIRPNMVIDQEATDRPHVSWRATAVEPIVYKQGQNIVVKARGPCGAANQLRYARPIWGMLNNDHRGYEHLSGRGAADHAEHDGAAYRHGAAAHPEYAMISRRISRRLILLFIVCIVTLGRLRADAHGQIIRLSAPDASVRHAAHRPDAGSARTGLIFRLLDYCRSL